ncbi:bifunctional lysylphosphatidylglycerol flippase/synthetase MprF [Labedaea rhizosphaerae]|uniref:bifunctional lysylphosphatidylglycerol flippase/synthetase MprF n=1 Tax=Labedaea rhizosphaerae TaxID=598644 RepID=UPI001415197D|nr:phosphatidylglycerol lysyltransferase domain-containing protein [Labedaea rhizosphaerae]
MRQGVDDLDAQLRAARPRALVPAAAGTTHSRARWLGAAVAATGVLTLVSTLGRPWPAGLDLAELLFTVTGRQVAHGTAVLAGAALVVVGRGVAQRRRLALYMTVALLLIATGAHLVRGLDLPAAAVTAVLAALLLRWRRLFVVPLRPARVLDLVPRVAVLLALDVVYGLAGLYTHLRVINAATFAEVSARLVGLPGPLTLHGPFAHWFPASLTGLGTLTFLVFLLALLAPVAFGGPAGDDRAVARRMVAAAAADTLDPFVLRRDKHLVFSPDLRAVLGYRYVRGVGLASGDPVGDVDAFPDAVREFVDRCDRHGWRPAIVGARQDRAQLFHALGLRTLYIGDEAVIDVPAFTLAGRPMRNARQAVSRSRNAGLTTEVLRERDVPEDLRQDLLRVLSQAREGQREFGFSMALGDLFSGDHPDSVVIVCRDREGKPVGFQRYLRCRDATALTVDIMRRLPDAPNGASERMIVDMLEWAYGEGISQLSLNFAAFRAILDPAAERNPAQAVTAWLIHRMDGRFGIQLDTLRVFNSKFRPRWVPRVLVYRTVSDLPAVGLAALAAEGFLPLDRNRQQDDD